MTAKVLVVDDDEILGCCVRQSLELGFPGCAVEVARSGAEALTSMAGQAHDLIITDYHMPGGVDGLDVIGAARLRSADVPVILMTGLGSARLHAEAAALGVHHLVQKPFDLDYLLAVAGRFLSPQ
jgi:CheY-like chemotaxis protein